MSAPTSPPPLVALREVSYAYPDAAQPALRNLSCTIHPGEIVALLGPSGAGKSTLCLALMGIVPQFHRGRFWGELTVNGHDVVDHPIPRLSQSVGLVLQDPATQLVTASVENEVAFALENAALPVAEIRARVDEALAAVHLTEFRHKHPHDLSGGQQQRLALAAALAQQPPLIVLDEPTSQLDPASTAEVFALVTELNSRHGTTFLIASHATEEIAATAHRALLLDAGTLVADAPIGELMRDPGQLSRLQLRPPEVTSMFAHLRRQGIWPADRPLPITLPEATHALQHLPAGRHFLPVDPVSPERGQPILTLRDVTHRYPDGTVALDGVTLDIPRGEYCLLIGQNGAGKSTLLQLLMNLLTPTSGEVRLDGVSLSEFKVAELARRIGYVPQNPDQQLFNATVEAEVGFSLQTADLDEATRTARRDGALEAMNLTHLRHAHPFSLSKGDRARVVMAAVLAMDPEVLIFDEPTTGQDAAGARAILDLTRSLHARGRTIIIVTHHLYLMPEYARRALVMGRGRLLLDAPLRDAFHDIDTLRRTAVEPTQAVALAQAVHPHNRAVSPGELAESYLFENLPA